MKAVEFNHQNDIEAVFEKYSSNFDSTLDAADKVGVSVFHSNLDSMEQLL
jgi:hypothetical protein